MGFYRKEESDMLTALLTIAFLEAVAGMAAVFLTKEFALIRILDWTEDKGVIGTAAGLCFAFLLLPYLMAEVIFALIWTAVTERREKKRGNRHTGRKMIDEQPTAYEANDWIPCSKRLPEQERWVLATVMHSAWVSDYDSKWVKKEEKNPSSKEFRNLSCACEYIWKMDIFR